MDDKEFYEVLRSLRAAGWEPMVCDTEIDVYDNPVKCGEPRDVGDTKKETEWYPHELLPPNRVFKVPAKGDSMRDAGIEAGDMLTIETETRIMDDDLVLACIDGEFTVKAYCEDDEGVKWLVPFNDQYAPIMLSADKHVFITGKVIEISKRNPRVTHRDTSRIVRKNKESRRLDVKLAKEEKMTIIRTVAPLVTIGRQWFAVYNPLAHRKQIEKGNYASFCELVNEAVPDHEKLPLPLELQRMDVQSFAKPIALWDEDDAPVRGARFKKYKEIGLKVVGLMCD